MNCYFNASMMCANYGCLENEVKKLENAGIDSFHIDIMDGRYVPNFAMSLNDMAYIASDTDRSFVVWFDEEECKYIELKEVKPNSSNTYDDYELNVKILYGDAED